LLLSFDTERKKRQHNYSLLQALPALR
jgi:hypothetical protein